MKKTLPVVATTLAGYVVVPPGFAFGATACGALRDRGRRRVRRRRGLRRHGLAHPLGGPVGRHAVRGGLGRGGGVGLDARRGAGRVWTYRGAAGRGTTETRPRSRATSAPTTARVLRIGQSSGCGSGAIVTGRAGCDRLQPKVAHGCPKCLLCERLVLRRESGGSGRDRLDWPVPADRRRARGSGGPDTGQVTSPAAQPSSCSARPGRSAPRRSTSCAATRTGSGSSGWPPAAATSSCSPGRRSSWGSRWSRWPGRARPRTCSSRSTPPRRPAATAPATTRCRRSWPGRTPRPSWPAWPCDVVLNGITGSIGLAPTLAALEAGRTLALANKESLVAGGPLVQGGRAPRRTRSSRSTPSTRRWPSACAAGPRTRCAGWCSPPAAGRSAAARRDELHDVTPEQALAHPTWDMGPVVTINSATLVNKGLELIEAHLLFDVPYDRIDVVVHPQSVVHSMVEFVDGSTLAQASPPDMRLPIALALGWPDRVPARPPGCDWTTGQHLGVPPARRRGVPRGAAGQGGRRGRRHRPGGLQRRQRGVRRGVPRRPAALHGDRRHRRPGARRARAGGNALDRRWTSLQRPRPGRGAPRHRADQRAPAPA